MRIPFPAVGLTIAVIVFVFHCHVVKHEDKGIMMSIEVKQPVRASVR